MAERRLNPAVNAHRSIPQTTVYSCENLEIVLRVASRLRAVATRVFADGFSGNVCACQGDLRKASGHVRTTS